MDSKANIDYVEIVPFYPVSVIKNEDYFLLPAQVMKEREFNASIFTYYYPNLPKVCKVDGITISSFLNSLDLFKHIQNNSLVHCHGFTRRMLFIYLLLIITGKKCIKILTPHTSFGIKLPYGLKFKVHKFLRFVFNSFDAIITTNAFEQEFYLKNDFKKVYKIPLAVDVDFFLKIRNNDFKDKFFREKFGIKEGTFNLIFLGGVRNEKNPSTVIVAFNLLKHEYGDAKLFIVGCSDQSAESKLRKLISKNYSSDVFFIQRLDPYSDIYNDIFKAGNIFINSSPVEGFCLGAYEAAACGLGLCLSDIGSFTSVFKNSALFHHPNDSLKLKDNLLKYIRDKGFLRRHIDLNTIIVKSCDPVHVKDLLAKIYLEQIEKREKL